MSRWSHALCCIALATLAGVAWGQFETPLGSRTVADPFTDRVYTITNDGVHGAGIYRYDPNTGAGSFVPGSEGAQLVAVNPRTNNVYAVGQGVVMAIDGSTLATTRIAAPDKQAFALAVDASANMAWGIGVSSLVPPGDGALWRLDATTDSLQVTSAIPGPWGLAVDEHNHVAYYNDIAGNTISAMPAGASVARQVATGVLPSVLGVDATRQVLYAAGVYGNELVAIDLVSGNTRRLTLPGTGADAIAVDAPAGYVYVAQMYPPRLIAVDSSTLTPLRTVDLPNLPTKIVVDSFAHKVYASWGTTVLLDPATGETHQLDVGAEALDPFSSSLYVTGPAKRALPSPFPTVRIPVGRQPVAIAINSQTHRVYVANAGSNDVMVFDEDTGASRNIPAGTAPSDLAVNEATGEILVANSGSNNVTVIDGATGAVTAIVPLDASPSRIRVNPATGKAYVLTSDCKVRVLRGSGHVPVSVTAGRCPGAIAVDSVHNRVYVGSDFMSILTGASLVAIDGTDETIRVLREDAVTALAVNPATNTIYAGSHFLSYVYGVDATTSAYLGLYTGSISSRNALGAPLIIVDSPANRLYAGEWAVDASTKTTLARMSFSFAGMANDPAAHRLYVPVPYSNEVAIVDSQDYSVAMVAAGARPVQAVVDPATHTAYVLNVDSEDITVVDGTKVVLPGPRVLEFYHAALDHYFMTTSRSEVHDLVFGVHSGWSATGASFRAEGQTQAGATSVCRFYMPPAFGDSHFYSGSAQECAEVRAKFPGFVFETDAAFHTTLPDTVTGACPSGLRPVYRTWNGRADSNHRYTTDRAVRDAMIAAGSIAEGYGDLGTVMCTP